MDYSLLVGIHDRHQGGPHQQTRSNTPFRRQTEVFDAHELAAVTTAIAATDTPASHQTGSRGRVHSTMSSNTQHSHDPSDISDHVPRIVKDHHSRSGDLSGNYYHDDELKVAFDENSEFTELEDESHYEYSYGMLFLLRQHLIACTRFVANLLAAPCLRTEESEPHSPLGRKYSAGNYSAFADISAPTGALPRDPKAAAAAVAAIALDMYPTALVNTLLTHFCPSLSLCVCALRLLK